MVAKRKSAIKDESDEFNPKVESDESQAEEVQHTLKKAKKTKVHKPVSEDEQGETTVQISPEGDKYVLLGKRKRATVRIFKGITMVDIREFYEKDGQELPGKKGISLNADQWKVLRQNADLIDSLLADIK